MNLRAFAVALGLCGVVSPALAQETVNYYHLDALGSVRLVTSSTGVVVERHDYLPYGEECTTGPCATNPGIATGQPLRFTGKERDQETGLDYFGARYYRPQVGRFTTVDPVMAIDANLANPQRWNRYSYSLNNPIRYKDPDGKVVVPAAAWIAFEVGMAVHDISDAYATYNDPGASSLSKTITIAGAVAGVVGFGGGYGRAGREVTEALVKYDGEFAARQILGEVPLTPGGRSITPHAAGRMREGGPGRRPMTKAEVDQVLDEGDTISKVDMNHPRGPTVTVKNTKMPGKPEVAVDAATGNRVVTVIQPKN